MIIVQRVARWLVEMLLAAVALGIYMRVAMGPWRAESFASSVLQNATFNAVILFWASGYLITTLVAALVLRNKSWWIYPVVATVLLPIHLQWVATGWTAREKLPFQIAGALIVASVSLIGGWMTQRRRNEFENCRNA